jgi:hypothetical protein
VVAPWPQVRAGLIAVAIGFGLVNGCPIPPPKETPEWERGLLEPVRPLQRAVLWPVAWIGPTLRVNQRWALYQNPAGERSRLWTEGQTADLTWHVYYRAADPDHDEDASVLEPARMWGIYEPNQGAPPGYVRFCHWITTRLLDHHPEAVAVRIRLEDVHIVRGGFESRGSFQHECVRKRGVP